MKKAFLLLFLMACTALQAQKIMKADQVKANWQSRSIKVAMAKPNIVQLMKAFQQTWPTYSGGELMKFAQLKAKYDNNDKIVDLANGFVLYSEDDPDSESDEILQACVWNRSNGHRLFAVNLHAFTNEIDVLCFYDFNPQTQTLTPEKSLSNLFKPSFTGYRYRVELPQKGKNLVVTEHFGGLSIHHTYSWDGMKPVRPQITIEKLDYYWSMFREEYYADDNQPFTKYTLIDVDFDGMPELWLSSDDEEYQAVFDVYPVNRLLGGQDGRRFLSFYPSVVVNAGSCGALCSSSVYVLMDEGCVKSYLVEETVLDMSGEGDGTTTYRLDGKQIAEKEGEKMVSSFGKEIEYKPQWRELSIE